MRRKQLLDAAQALIMELGYETMTMSDVAERAGVGKGTVYLYFDSKADLLQGLRVRYWDEIVSVARDATTRRTRSWHRRVSQLFEDLVDHSIREHAFFHAIYSIVPTTDISPHDVLSEILAGVLREGQAAAEFEIIDVDVTARMMVSGYNGMIAWILHAPPRERRARTRLMLEHFDRLLGIA